MSGMDGAVESAIGGMLFVQQASSSSSASPLRNTSPKKLWEMMGEGEGHPQLFGLSRPIMSGIRARIGVLRGRAETAPARIETNISSTTTPIVRGATARFIAGDREGGSGPVRLIDMSDVWRWSVC